MHIAQALVLLQHKDIIDTNRVQVRIIGDLSLLPARVQQAADRVMKATCHHQRCKLNICMAYTWVVYSCPSLSAHIKQTNLFCNYLAIYTLLVLPMVMAYFLQMQLTGLQVKARDGACCACCSAKDGRWQHSSSRHHWEHLGGRALHPGVCSQLADCISEAILTKVSLAGIKMTHSRQCDTVLMLRLGLQLAWLVSGNSTCWQASNASMPQHAQLEEMRQGNLPNAG